MKTTLLAVLLTASGLWAQIPTPTPAAAETNREEILRRALRRAMEGKTPSPAIPVPSATNTAAEAPPPALAAEAPPPALAPDAGTVAADALTPATNRVLVPNDPALAQRASTNRLAQPSNPRGTNVPARIALPSNPVPAAAGPPTIPAPETVPGTPPATEPPALTTSSLSTNISGGEEMIPAGVINFQAVDINEVMKIYGELLQRTILRPTLLPGIITLKTQTPLTKREAIQALDAVLALNGVSVILVGEKFVKIVPSTQANQTGAAFSKQAAKDLPEMGSYVTHVVQLKYVKPSELVQVLQPFASAIPNPILPIDGSQILVLRDYTENVKRMLELVSEIDVAVEAEFVSEVIPIKYALASEISAALNSLSTGGGGATVGQVPGGTAAGGPGGARRTSGFGSQRTLGGGGYPGSAGGLLNPQGAQGVGGVQTPGAGGAFTDRLRSIIQRASTTGEIQVIGQTKIIADERTNSLLIFASRADMQTIKKIISQLDVVLAQVLIEAVIIQVSLNKSTDVGISYLQHPKSVGQFNTIGGLNNVGFVGNGAFGAGTNGVPSLGKGLTYFGQLNQDLDVTLTALASDNRTKILQRPRIQTSHAVQAQLFVGESRPYPTGSYYGGGSFGGYSSIQQLSIGVTLDVTPLINPDGLVVMDIHQTIEDVVPGADIDVSGTKVPTTSRKEASAKVAVRDRDTIMLGGLISTTKSKGMSGVPLLMDIPLLGYLFRSNSDSEDRVELIVLIRPTVLPTPEVAALTAKAEKDRMPGVSQAEKEILEGDAARLKQADKRLKDK